MSRSPNTTTAPTGSIAPFGLRMLPALKDRLEESAKANGRSMNAEISARLQLTFDQPMLKMLTDDLQRSGEFGVKIQHLTDLVDTQRKAIGAQELNVIMLATHIVALINKLPKRMQDDEDVRQAAEFALSLDIGEKIVEFHARTGTPMQASSVTILDDDAPRDGIVRIVSKSPAIQAAERKRIASKKK